MAFFCSHRDVIVDDVTPRKGHDTNLQSVTSHPVDDVISSPPLYITVMTSHRNNDATPTDDITPQQRHAPSPNPPPPYL